ncbi:MAG TPA: flagellar biosynthesis protein FlhA [Clostridia bacterium]|nr:flagellar biosynthesis protein FlhA [Clostridia bacterium]
MNLKLQSFSLNKISKLSDISVALGIVGIVIIMIVKLPSFLLDIFLTLNITLSLLILLISIYTLEPLQFSIFPSLLLLTTLFRLSLNISSTRLILLEGNAGNVINAFGKFVVGGNPVVGFVIFLILVVIQFVVITKGAERVAEVAARFTLDAMPGKQMSIDADLNAGLITEEQARARRKDIQRQADFYGAMDGASKFVKGDAIAGIIITFINIIGGIIIGVIFPPHLTIMGALQKYLLLTVGDGLVNQIPALLISTAMGIIVTRAASENNLGQDVIKQLFSQPKVMAITSVMVLIFVFIPGLPKLPFLFLSVLFGGLFYLLKRSLNISEVEEKEVVEEKEIEAARKPENVFSLLHVDPLEIEIGYGLIPLADYQQGGDLMDRIVMIRRQCALELGIVIPTVRIRDNMQLKPNSYIFKIKGIEVARGELLLDHFLAMNPESATDDLDGIETLEPAFGLPAKWIHESKREMAEMMGYTVVDPPSVLATHFTEVIRNHAHELLGRQETQSLIDTVRESHPAVVNELIPGLMSLGEVQKILANLLRERVSIRDMVTILETLADYAPLTKDPGVLTEYVRASLARQISQMFVNQDGVIQVIVLNQDWEKTLTDNIQHSNLGSYISISPSSAQELYTALKREIEKVTALGVQPIVLCSPNLRLPFKRLTERWFPNLAVISYGELLPDIEVESIGMVSG